MKRLNWAGYTLSWVFTPLHELSYFVRGKKYVYEKNSTIYDDGFSCRFYCKCN